MSAGAPLLVQATDTLSAGGPHSARAACWMVRAALEDAVDELLGRFGHPCSGASMRSKLLVLAAVSEDSAPDLAPAARSAWHGLSGHCHHHAFELTPPAFEVAHLISVVATVMTHTEIAGDAAQTAPPGSTTH